MEERLSLSVVKGQQQGQQRFGKQVRKPSGPSGRNDGSQVHEIKKWALRRQIGLKKLKKKEIAYPWAVYKRLITRP